MMQAGNLAVSALMPLSEQAKEAVQSTDKMYVFKTSDPKFGQVVITPDSAMELGRGSGFTAESSHLCIKFPAPILSQVHARLAADEKGVFLVDVGTNEQGSTNGTFINGIRIPPMKPCYLTRGDLISLGPPKNSMSVHLHLVINGESA